MARAQVSWLIGQTRIAAGSTITTNGGSDDLTDGLYYLDNSNSSLSLLQNLEDVLTNLGHTGASVYMDYAGLIHINANAAFSLNWSSTAQRELFGYTGNLSSAATHVGSTPSSIMWNPRYPSLTTSRLGIEGYSMPDTYIISSPSGLTSTARTHYTPTFQEMNWETVHIDQLWDSSNTPGTFQRFVDEVLLNHYAFYEAQYVAWDTSSTTDANVFTNYTPLGPYKLRDIESVKNWYKRTLENADLYAPVSLAVQVVS